MFDRTGLDIAQGMTAPTRELETTFYFYNILDRL